ncbi:MAG: insulinase family protein [Candidatus Coatesbacteria bacterium]|nr:insulinase family protein [Candidatus Coatesbacteria bacterium]
MSLKHVKVGVAALALLMLIGPTEGSSAMIPPAEVALARLPSGLTVAVAEDRSAPVVAVQIIAKAGSILERDYLGCGISHFVEHVENDGTAKMTKEEIERFSAEFGGLTNAYTTSDHTCYHAVAPSRYFERVLFLLSHCYTQATFPKEEVETQRGIILNEIAKDLDEPMRVLWREMMRTMFKRHPVRQPTIGQKELFVGLSRDDLLKYYSRMYVPANTIVVIVGDVDQSQALEKVQEAFRDFAARPFAPVVLPEEPRQICARSSVLEMDVSLAYLMLGYRTVPLQHPDLYALDVLAAILGSGRSARVVQNIKDKQCLVQDITVSSWTENYGIGAFFIRAALPCENIDQTVAAVRAEVEAVKATPVSEQELKKAKKLIRSHYLLDVDTMEQKARLLSSDLLATDEVGFSYRYLDGIEGVTAAEVAAVANRYLNDDQLCTVSIVPKGKAAARAGIKEGAATEAPAIEKATLPNGLRLLTQQGRPTATVSIDAYFTGGTRYEKPETNGVANLMARLLLRGTKSKSAEEIAFAVDQMGARVSASSDMNTFHVSLEVLGEDLEQGLELMADIILHPKFDEEEFGRQKKNALAVIERQGDLWYEKPRQTMLSNLYSSHPYRMSQYGSTESVLALTVDDVWDYYDAYVKPDNVVLSVFGVADSGSTKSLVEKLFAEFSGSAVRPSISLDAPLSENIFASEKTGWNQAAVFYGFRSCSVSNEDKYALDVLDAVISGIHSPGGRLHSRLRNSELVYLVHAYNRLGIDPGWFSIYASCLPTNLERVQKIIVEEVIRIGRDPVSDQELTTAKGMCLAAEQVYRRQTASQLAAAACLSELYGLGFDSFLQYEKSVEAVTAEDVMRVARKYFAHCVQVTSVPEAAGK